MTLRLRGNNEFRWVWQGNIYSVHGDGVTPEHPISEAGGVHVVRCDVQVPAIPAGAAADWNIPYPGLYAPGTHELDLIRYINPLDVAPKLNGKGNLALLRTYVLQGTTITGAAPPTQAGGNVEIIVERLGTVVNPWYFNGVMPVVVGNLTASSQIDDATIIGSDGGLGTRLVLHINAITNPIVAGRWRFVFLVAEV